MRKLFFVCILFTAQFALACDRLLAIDIAKQTAKDLARSMGATIFLIGEDSLSDDGRSYNFIFSFKINNQTPSAGIINVETDSCYSTTKRWGAAKEFFSN